MVKKYQGRNTAATASLMMSPSAGGADSEKLMQDLIKSAQRPVAAGKVRRKKTDAAAKRAAPLNKSKGFASVNAR